jgi:20S proteasome alpha/beta subunit
MEPESSRLLDHPAVDKVSRVEDGIWIASAGLLGDSRQLVRQARKYCVNYRARYGARPSVKSVAHHIGSLQHDASLAGGLRPFGVHLLTAGFEESFTAGGVPQKVPAVYLSRASGEVTQWEAVAIGKFSDKMLQLLENTVYVGEKFVPGEAAAVDAAVGILGKVASRRTMGGGDGRAGSAETDKSTTINQSTDSSASSSESDRSIKSIESKRAGDGEDEKPNTYNIYTLKTDNQLVLTTRSVT